MRWWATFPILATACVGPVDAARCADETGELADACWMATLGDTGQGATGAQAHCAHVDDPTSRDHCLVAAATTLGFPYAEARQVCEQVAAPLWRDECHFQALEQGNGELDPVRYVTACRADAGRFAASCIDHGSCYWAENLLRPDAPHWFRPDGLDAQLQAVQAAGARSHNMGQLAQVLRWRVRGGRPPRAASAGAGALAGAAPVSWADAAATPWW